jgi:hypothetical protein
MNDGGYRPSPTTWVRDQVETIEATGNTRSVSIMDRPVVLVTMRGARTGAVRKVPLMRVEHPPYAEYQERTARRIPVLLLEPVGH